VEWLRDSPQGVFEETRLHAAVPLNTHDNSFAQIAHILALLPLDELRGLVDRMHYWLAVSSHRMAPTNEARRFRVIC
jgi:hypothetical protein